MNDLCADIGHSSINHSGEELCGDHVDIVESKDGDSTVIVLADGLGSGVQASILSTLTSRIISTMMSEGLSLEDCVTTIAATLPVNTSKGAAYSTFTIMNLISNEVMDLIQYENPDVILIRDGVQTDYPKEEITVDSKKILHSRIRLREDDMFVAMSDGCPYAGPGNDYNYDWKPEDIADFMATMATTGYTSKVLSSMLVDQCYKLYDEEPRDDATACIIKIKKRVPMNLLFGPPEDRADNDRMMSLFFSKEGKHIVCGGTSASIAASWLHKPVKTNTRIIKGSDIPPISLVEGIDLVTEGVITMNRVLEYAEDYIKEHWERYEEWNYGKDGASLICQLLFEEATDINLFIGKAVNPAHAGHERGNEIPEFLNIKMYIAEKLSEYLRKMGKHVRISYF